MKKGEAMNSSSDATLGLERFINAQDSPLLDGTAFGVALAEISRGRKLSHWMWYVFPQLKGLGESAASQYYGVRGAAEARAYLSNDLLRARLEIVCKALLRLNTSDPCEVFGYIDSLKLCSSMTLFEAASGVQAGSVYALVLDKFFNGERDEATLSLLKEE